MTTRIMYVTIGLEREATNMSTYVKRPVSEVTTQDLIATIAADRDSIATFEARRAFTARTGTDWRVYAPTNPRTRVEGVYWHNFLEEGWI